MKVNLFDCLFGSLITHVVTVGTVLSRAEVGIRSNTDTTPNKLFTTFGSVSKGNNENSANNFTR